MNLTQNQNSYPFPNTPNDLYTNEGCGCHRAVHEGKTLVATLDRTTAGLVSSISSAIGASKALDWQGNAATLFQQRMAELLTRATALRDECRATDRLAQQAGA
ncbi:hypothetical protein [Bifidobacterium sp. ESL0790]|uniref:hypothetical protein n=1 Tax=Bifidobacterium sp. ESL0790 TaxID=2983233 RepID=UPI0023F71946|nr:hypothetical protein [Bifidobacterium sp. ESL0790]WEV71871.1 hypothetical protein OZY47_05285 [Bifidobacterium sp. ESL0790]